MELFNKKQLLKCCFSRLKPLSCSICEKALNPNRASTHLYSHTSSYGSHSIQSFSVSVYCSRIRALGKIRSFSVSSSKFYNIFGVGSDESTISSNGSYMIQPFRSFTVSSSDFDNMTVIGSDDSVLKVRSFDENVPEDNQKLLSDIFKDDESASSASSRVTKVDEGVAKADSKLVREIVEAIRNSGEEKLEKEIVLKGRKFSTHLLNEVFCILNSEKISGLPFLAWAQDKNPRLLDKADFRSLIIDNCGWLGDYDAMLRLLEAFSAQGICLTKQAFGFFASFGMDKDLTMVSIKKVVGILNEVGGSCRGTGVVELIKMFCMLDLMEMAMFVIQITEKKLSYYNTIVREMCIRSRLDEARDFLEEMRKSSCDPDVLSYSYILSSLCKNGRTEEACYLFEEMEKKGCEPDALSFEIIILSMCKLGKMNVASQYFGQMIDKGIEPRNNTSAALIKGYFNSENYEEALKFVVNLGVAYKSCGDSAYSLLVRLHFGKGDVVIAGKILMEMLDKNFIPHFTLCKHISKQLLKLGQKQMANDIARFSQLRNGIEMRLRNEKSG